MLQKVKKFSSKLFGDGVRDAGSPRFRDDADDFTRSPAHGRAIVQTAMSMDLDSSPGSKGSSQMAVDTSGASKLCLPPVNGSFTSQLVSRTPSGNPQALSGSMAPTAAGSGRRKSTPAALDMALRTPEGKAAIDDLINASCNKQMVFGQYFGAQPGKDGSARGVTVAPPGVGSMPTGLGVPSPMTGSTRFQKAAAAVGVANTLAQPAKVMQSVREEDASASPSSNTVHTIAAVYQQPHHASGQARPWTPPAGQQAASAGPVWTFPAAPAITAPRAPAAKRAAVETAAVQHQAHTQAPAPAQPTQAAPPQGVQAEPALAARTKMLHVAQQVPASMSRKHWCLADFSIMCKMYTGYASTVYQATCRKSLEQVALKVYHMDNLCELNHYQVYREVRVHAGLSHQHIIKLYSAFQEGSDVVLVQEYAEGGDLYKLLHRNGGRLGERQAVEMVLHPFLLALHYLHTRGIMHRDIKPENVLFTEHRVLKLADFGLAIDLNEERAVTRAGTLDYMAPEVLRCPPKNLPQENKNNTALHYNNSVDAWAVGVFAYELVVGLPPFAGETQLASVDKIINQAIPTFPEKMSELAKAFITAALKKHPADRPSVIEMLHHPWIRTYQRRTSVRIPQLMTHRHSHMQGPGTPGADMPLANVPANMDNMTPEEIETMIKQLQMAKSAMEQHSQYQM